MEVLLRSRAPNRLVRVSRLSSKMMHRAPSTEHRAPSTEHGAPSTEHREAKSSVLDYFQALMLREEMDKREIPPV